MKKSMRRLSALLAFTLIFGLFAAFPAIGIGAESVNLALDGDYMYTIQSAVHSRSIDGDRAASYGDGILNNGQKPDYDHNDATLRSQFSYVQRTGLTAAGFEVTYDLGAVCSIEKVVITGYHYTSTFGLTPGTTDAVFRVSACDIADGTYTELGNNTVAAMGSTAQAYTGEIAAEGTGRYVKITIDNPAQYMLLSEIEIFGTKTAADPESSDDVSEDDTTSDDVSDDVSEDISGDDVVDEDDVVTKNIAGNATYRGTDNSNGTGNYGEENWNTYHAGKLNDGVIPEGDSESTKGQNVEIYIAGFVAGTVYVYFDLGEAETVTELVTYTNERLSSTNRGYPSFFNVYVGDTEELASATLFGAAATTDEGAVRKYTATGNATGRYVILELGIASPDIVIALSEVEIYAVQEPVNHAGNATYKGEGDDNGTTGSYSEVGVEWNEYHTGKLNDGTIATDASNAQTGLSVEFYNAGYAVGVNKLYFKFDYEVDVREVIGYFNNRNNSANRGYPSLINVYVGDSEDIATATLIGEATTTDEGYVRAYSVKGSAKGTYVIFEMTISNPVAVIALTEVEIIGYGDAPEAEPELPKLDAPVLSSSTDKFTYFIPTITWEAVEGAVGYDVYLDGVLALENTTELSFTPDVATRADYNSSNAYKVTVVAKTGSEEAADSLPSEAAEFIYVDMPTDIDGNPLASADFIIDAGHGGTDPGALGDGGAREEADDNLAMAKAVGERLTALGFTVAYTRITDVFDTVLTKAAKGEAGSFGYYMCFHRNSFSDERANGVETLYKPNDSGSNQAFARLVQDEIMALGIFTNRNIKERTDLTVLNNVTSMPVILMELSFISNTGDNEKFDTYFNDIATAVVRGALTNAGYKTGFEGAVIANGNDYTITDEALDIHLDLTNYDPENSVLELEFGIANGLGIEEIAVSVNDGEWINIDIEDNIVIYGASEFKAGSVLCAYTKDFLGMEAGHYTLKYKMVHTVKAGPIYKNETIFLTVNLNVAADPAVLGDVNDDGSVDNLDAVLVLQYDAGLIDETGLNLENGDMNDDGIVDNLDAVLMLKTAAGLMDTELEFRANVIRTNGGWSEEDVFPAWTVISSVEELNAYVAENSGKYSFNHSEYNTPSFNDVIEAYDESFFGSKALVLIVTWTGTGSVDQEVTGVSLADGVLTVAETDTYPFLQTTDIAHWHTVIEIDADAAAKVESIDFDITVINETE